MTPRFHSLFVKRIDALTADSAQISFAIPPDLRDAFAFKPGQFLTLRAQIEALARENPNIDYLGFREGRELRDLYLASSVVLVPSRRDPWPLVACEALSVGRPVVLGRGVGSAADLASVAGGAVAGIRDRPLDGGDQYPA